MICKTANFKQLYDRFINSCYFSPIEYSFFAPENRDTRERCITTGYIVNKETEPQISKLSFYYQVFDHIRHIEEILSGLFITDNPEFNHILKPFLSQFMLNNIWVIYSEEFKEYELKLAATKAQSIGQDPLEIVEKAFPESNFRLLRRVSDEKGTYRWDCILSGLQDVKIDEFLPIKEQTKITPIRVSFNEGYMFTRFYQIFATYEAQMQTYKKLFNALHKIGDINGEDTKAIQSKISQMDSPEVFTYTVSDQADNMTTIENLNLVQNMSQLTESYDNIHALLNDSLAKLGLAGDDSTKAERITTGENFRALQPNMSFQQAILRALNNVTERIQKRFNQSVQFSTSIHPNQQGIPVLDGQNNNYVDKG